MTHFTNVCTNASRLQSYKWRMNPITAAVTPNEEVSRLGGGGRSNDPIQP